MRARILLMALLLAPLVGFAPGAGAQTSCLYYTSQDVQPVSWSGYYANVTRYHCATQFSSKYVEHRVDLVHLAERDLATESDVRVLAHLQIESYYERTSTGSKRETYVMLKDTTNIVSYNELEYRRESSGGDCSGTLKVYRGSQYNPWVATPVPCVPGLPLLL